MSVRSIELPFQSRDDVRPIAAAIKPGAPVRIEPAVRIAWAAPMGMPAEPMSHLIDGFRCSQIAQRAGSFRPSGFIARGIDT